MPPAGWGSQLDIRVVETNYDEYALLYTKKFKGTDTFTMVTLYGTWHLDPRPRGGTSVLHIGELCRQRLRAPLQPPSERHPPSTLHGSVLNFCRICPEEVGAHPPGRSWVASWGPAEPEALPQSPVAGQWLLCPELRQGWL